MPNKVQMNPAYCWTCDECGRDNFVRAVRADISEEESLDKLRKMGQLQPYEELPEGVEGDWITYPDHVKCNHCEAEFDSENPGDIEGE
jgi:hypothetical protein